ncbi:MAG: protease complex subunit PrcB family protein [Pyrinomonadaceae bacterium]|nr:protease complex subunit PrcB family protein [Pyrinomonadaceae bacterium]
MRIKRTLTILIALGFLSTFACAQKSLTLEELRNMKKKTEKPKEGALKSRASTDSGKGADIVSEGSYSKVDKPFIFVVRDAETYKLLGDLIGDFKPGDVDFEKNAIVAAFSGEKMTGGYAVSIKLVDGVCVIGDVAPAHGAIVTEALTRPFALVSVPIEEEGSLAISADETWTASMDDYRVVKGEFSFTGGFIGLTRKYGVEGILSVSRFGEFVTISFDVKGTGDEASRKMRDIGSGKMDEKMPELLRIEGGNLIDRPHPPLQVDTDFGENVVKMKFTPGKRPYIVNDGFEGKGWLEAKLISTTVAAP